MNTVIAQTVQEIKTLKIQGAQSIAKAAVSAIAYFLKTNNCSQKEYFSALEALRKARPTEPTLVNALQYFILSGGQKKPVVAAKIVQKYFVETQEKINHLVEQIIVIDKQYFTHCHASTITKALIHTFKKKRFSVANTETRPLFQGRKTAFELTQAKIPVTHSIDSAGRILIKDSTAIYFGADAILADGSVINKIGSELFAEIAKARNKPVYVVTQAFKFSGKTMKGYEQELEERKKEEVWKDAPKEVHILNYAFERIDEKNITAIISELGILKPKAFVKAVIKKYPWIAD